MNTKTKELTKLANDLLAKDKFAYIKKAKKPTKKQQRRKEKDLRFAAVGLPIERPRSNPNDRDFLCSYEWRSLRFIALRKYGAKCCLCGATPASGAIMNVDHIKPRKHYPELALDLNNLQILCEPCNHGKGNKTAQIRG